MRRIGFALAACSVLPGCCEPRCCEYGNYRTARNAIQHCKTHHPQKWLHARFGEFRVVDESDTELKGASVYFQQDGQAIVQHPGYADWMGWIPSNGVVRLKKLKRT